MGDIELDAKVFSRHIRQVYDRWKNGEFGGVACDAISFSWGKSDVDPAQSRTVAAHCYLFQYEMPETILVLTASKFHIIAGPKKIELLTKLKSSSDYSCPVELNLMLRDKKDNTGLFNKIIEDIKSSHKGHKIGVLNEESSGSLIDGWNSAISSFEKVDISKPLAHLLVIKDEQEIKCLTTAASITSAVMKNSFVTHMETVVDEGKTVSHQEISDYVNKFYEKPEKISSKLNPSVVDRIYDASIQSGGKYDLSYSPPVGEGNLKADCIILQLGTRYKSYCATVGRTYLIDPDKVVQSQYGFLVQLYDKIFDLLHPGTSLKHIYNSAVSLIEESKHKNLVSHFLPDCGTALGLQVKDDEFTINANNKNVLKKNMVINLRLGFQNLQHNGKKYALFLSDTVLITDEGPKLLTNVKKKTSDVCYFLEGEEEEEKPAKKEKEKPKKQKEEVKKEPKKETPEKSKPTPKPAKAEKAEVKEEGEENGEEEESDSDETPARRIVTRRRGKAVDKAQLAHEQKRAEHQRMLAQKQREEGLRKYAAGATVQTETTKKVKEYTAYKSHNDYPRDAERDKIFVDTDKEAILVPIAGILVPFHITCIRSVTKTEEHLRIIFKAPGAGSLTETFLDPRATFIKEVTYRMPSAKNLNNAFRLINELRKRVSARETAKSMAEEVPTQEALIKSPTPGARLVNLNIRPTLGGGRRTLGTLEAHENGFRFTTAKKGVVDIIYRNIKHAFFQPAENELIVLLHFHLHHPIIIGKKKTVDVQFYTEVMEASTALHRTSWGDQDEIEEEQREREMRNNLNMQFQNFVKKVEAFKPDEIEFDIPYRELGFYGVPHRANVLLQPTVHCLVNLVEAPFFVMTMDEIEIVYFERVEHGLKQFDAVFVKKDWRQMPIQINAIPVDSLEPIKDWLDSINIKFYEGKATINWKNLMAQARANPRKFWEDGGWAQISADFEESEEEGEAGEEEGEEGSSHAARRGGDASEEDDYQPSGSESEDYEYDESDSYSDEEFSEEESFEEEEEDDSENDWEAHERRAREEDMRRKEKRGRESDDEEDTRPKAKRVKK